LEVLLNDALDDFKAAVPGTAQSSNPSARDSNLMEDEDTSTKNSTAKHAKFDPLPARPKPAKATKTRKQLKGQPGEAAGSGLDGVTGPNLQQIVNELAHAHGWTSPADIDPSDQSQHLALEPMLARLQAENQDAESAGLSGLADSLMHQLLSKDVLYQPMKDIGERYPGWLSAHRDSLPKEDINRYEEQFRQIQKILKLYEDDVESYQELFEALQKMQLCGQPPMDIVNDLAPGLAFDEGGLQGDAAAGCTIQ